MTSVDTAPDLHGDDSYRVATDTVIPDDNLTATGTIKSYRKTPYTSRAHGLEDRNGSVDHEAILNGPRDEHRIPEHELLSRLLTDAACGLTPPQVHANLETLRPKQHHGCHGSATMGSFSQMHLWWFKSVFVGGKHFVFHQLFHCIWNKQFTST